MKKDLNIRANIPSIRNVLLIFLCFLLTSTSWLACEYHLLTQVSSRISDICTMVIGYLLQAAGIGVFAVMSRCRRGSRNAGTRR